MNCGCDHGKARAPIKEFPKNLVLSSPLDGETQIAGFPK
jgi:hypothetical protein